MPNFTRWWSWSHTIDEFNVNTIYKIKKRVLFSPQKNKNSQLPNKWARERWNWARAIRVALLFYFTLRSNTPITSKNRQTLSLNPLLPLSLPYLSIYGLACGFLCLTSQIQYTAQLDTSNFISWYQQGENKKAELKTPFFYTHVHKGGQILLARWH